jgi:hypothetical protein
MSIWHRIRYIFSRVLLILLGLCLGLAAGELVLRLVPVKNRFAMARSTEGLFESDAELLLRLRSDLEKRIYGHPEFGFTVRTNGKGLRDDPLTGSCDIAAIGDSFTFGFGVEGEDSWPEQLEEIGDVCVANLGWMGWNSLVYPDTIRRYAVPLQARIWVWAFFGNDLPESAAAEEYFASGETDYEQWVLGGRLPLNDPPFPLNLRTVQLLASLFDPELVLLPGSGDRIFDDGELRMRCGTYPWETTDPEQPEVQRGWELTEAALVEASSLSEVHDARLVVLFVPNREHVYWDRIAGLMEDVDIEQLDEVEARLETICEAHRIDYLNLLPGFRSSASSGQMLYFPQDGHWNEEGHALAATLVYEFLQEQGLLDD